MRRPPVPCAAAGVVRRPGPWRRRASAGGRRRVPMARRRADWMHGHSTQCGRTHACVLPVPGQARVRRVAPARCALLRPSGSVPPALVRAVVRVLVRRGRGCGPRRRGTHRLVPGTRRGALLLGLRRLIAAAHPGRLLRDVRRRGVLQMSRLHRRVTLLLRGHLLRVAVRRVGLGRRRGRAGSAAGSAGR